MDEEPLDIDGLSFDCDWCGVSFTRTPITTKRKTSCYRSMDCSRAGDLPVFAIMSGFGFLIGPFSLVLNNPDCFNMFILGFFIGFIFLFCSFDTWKIRRKTPRGSKTEQHLENDVG